MAAGDVTAARRIPVPDSGDANDVIFRMEPGDYCGPLEGYTGGKPAVFFIHVASPPHVFTEQDDGSLEIRESILADTGWHGYLDAGNTWREV